MAVSLHRGDNSAPSRAELLGRAEELVPVLRERADATEELRRLPDETEKAFHDSGLFRMLQPQRIGGSELDYGILIDAGATIAKGCASSAWNLTNLASHHWMMAMFPKQAQDEVWTANPDTLIASSFIFPAGRARRAPGGYVISGKWPFSSGVDNSDWNMLAGVVSEEDPEEPHEYRVFLLHKSDYEIIDTWFAAGLRGTGSKDVKASEVFVPEHRTLAVADTKGGGTPGSEVNPAVVYRLPVFALFPFVLSGVALGIAEGIVGDYVDAARSRVTNYTGAKVGDFQAVQIKVAEASAAAQGARLMMQNCCAEATAMIADGTVPDIERKVAYRRDGAFSVGLCTRAVDLIAGVSGAGGLYNRNPVQRAFRDVHAVNAHIAFNMDMAGTAYGRVAMGHSPDNPTL